MYKGYVHDCGSMLKQICMTDCHVVLQTVSIRLLLAGSPQAGPKLFRGPEKRGIPGVLTV